MRELFVSQKRAIDHFFQEMDLAEMEKLVLLIQNTRGTIIFTGVGKSGLIGQKIAATFTSTGTRAQFLCPTTALHGDIGILAEGDLLIALSKSGESEEILALLPHVQKRRVGIVAVVSTKGSRLEKSAEQTVHLPLLRELCPHDLSPTTSTVLQLIFGDILAVALLQKKNFSVRHFAENHPGGLLGRKITLRVSDLMLKDDALPLSYPTDKLIDKFHEFSSKRCGCLIVIDAENKLQGIFTDGDLRRSIQAKGPAALNSTLQELMTKSPKTISHNQMAIEAVRVMEEDTNKLITVLPVLDGSEVVGLIRMHDIVQAGLNV
jgi:arabinose-5-phosphate isomerase